MRNRCSVSITKRLKRFFRRRDAAIAADESLARAGFTTAELARAVKCGVVRRGTTGYWLPEPPDPGAILVMRRQIRQESMEMDGAGTGGFWLGVSASVVANIITGLAVYAYAKRQQKA